ncbi:MAG: hypothetical protein U0235_34225 [Polyangiaceae bacterium]
MISGLARLRAEPVGWNALLWIAAVATVAPLFVVAFLPFTDLPEHLAVMSSLRHWWDPAYRVQEHYTLTLGQSQYLLYHFTGAVLSLLVGDVDLANRLLLASIGIALPFSLRALLCAFDRDERLALFACPLFWSRPLLVGFLPFVASVPLMLYGLAIAVGVRDRKWRVWVLALLALALFYVHVSAFMLLAACSFVVVWARVEVRLRDEVPSASVARRLWRSTIESIGLHTWLLPAGAMAVGWAVAFGRNVDPASDDEVQHVARMGIARTVRAFALWTHDIWWSHVDEACAAVYWSAFVAVAFVAVRNTMRSRSRTTARRSADGAMLPFLFLALVYTVFPFQIGAGYMLNVRLAPILALFAILAAQRAHQEAPRWPLLAVFGVSIVSAADAAVEMRATVREELGSAGTLLEGTRMGARVLSLNFHISSEHTHFPAWLYFGSYFRVRRGGVAAFSFSELQHWPLHYRAENAPPHKDTKLWVFHPCLFRNAVDGAYYDYILVRGGIDPFRDQPPGPAFRSIGQAGDFTLYEKVAGRQFPDWETEDQGPCRSKPPTPGREE